MVYCILLPGGGLQHIFSGRLLRVRNRRKAGEDWAHGDSLLDWQWHFGLDTEDGRTSAAGFGNRAVVAGFGGIAVADPRRLDRLVENEEDEGQISNEKARGRIRQDAAAHRGGDSRDSSRKSVNLRRHRASCGLSRCGAFGSPGFESWVRVTLAAGARRRRGD